MAKMAKKRERLARTVRKMFFRYVLRIYHSILSTGVGAGFVSTAVTVPLLMWMTRSAIAVSAELCVMTMTVRPVLRQVSCKSFSTCLPVL